MHTKMTAAFKFGGNIDYFYTRGYQNNFYFLCFNSITLISLSDFLK